MQLLKQLPYLAKKLAFFVSKRNVYCVLKWKSNHVHGTIFEKHIFRSISLYSCVPSAFVLRRRLRKVGGSRTTGEPSIGFHFAAEAHQGPCVQFVSRGFLIWPWWPSRAFKGTSAQLKRGARLLRSSLSSTYQAMQKQSLQRAFEDRDQVRPTDRWTTK